MSGPLKLGPSEYRAFFDNWYIFWKPGHFFENTPFLGGNGDFVGGYSCRLIYILAIFQTHTTHVLTEQKI